MSQLYASKLQLPGDSGKHTAFWVFADVFLKLRFALFLFFFFEGISEPSFDATLFMSLEGILQD
jgi:hypothetical protein